MSLRLGDIVPDFKATSTEGEINFYEYLGERFQKQRRVETKNS